MLDHLSSKLGEHDMAIDQMEIASVNEGQIDDLSSPDIIIKHKGQFHRRETRIFVQEVNRKPTYSVCWYPRTPKRTCKEWPACPRCEETTDDWIFIIKKIDTETVMNWENLWPQFSKLWTDFNKRRKTRIDKITNQRGAQERDNQNRADLLEAQRRQERVAELYRIAKEEERKSIVRHKCIIAGLDPSFADCQVQSEKIEIISWLKSTFTRAYSSHSYQYMMEQNLRSLKKRKTLEIMRSRGYPNIANNYFSPPLALSSGE